MSTKINGISQDELRLRYAAMAGLRTEQNPGVNSQTIKPAGGIPTESATIDTSKINEVARKYAQLPVNCAAAAVSSYSPIQTVTKPQELPKVDGQTAINIKSGVKTVLPSALNFNASVASNLYNSTANKFKDVGQYYQLSNVKLQNTDYNKTTNSFAGNYTGLSFKDSSDDIIA